MSELHITNQNFETEVMHSDKPVLLDFFATWCGPCQIMLPIVGEIAQERADIKVAKINVDENAELARKFRVMSIPTLVVVKDGKVVKRSTGAISKDEVLAML